MNRTKIEWADYTWNPITGCDRGCFYCYAKPMFERFHPGQDFKEIHIYPERMEEPMKVKKPARIFVGSMTDIMDPRIPEATTGTILQIAENCPQHTFIFLTKSMYAYSYISDMMSDNCWMGITITGAEWELINMQTVGFLLQAKAKVKFINFEPLGSGLHKLIKPGIDWIIIGGLTGPGAEEHKPRSIEIATILQTAAKYGIPVFIKDNLKWYEEIKNFPK